MADRAAETGAAVPPRDCASSESPAEAVGTERRGTEREEDGEEEKPGAGGPDGSEPKRRESGARAESAEKGHESGDGACGSTAEKRGEPRDGAPVGGGERGHEPGTTGSQSDARVVSERPDPTHRCAPGCAAQGSHGMGSPILSVPRGWGHGCPHSPQDRVPNPSLPEVGVHSALTRCQEAFLQCSPLAAIESRSRRILKVGKHL